MYCTGKASGWFLDMKCQTCFCWGGGGGGGGQWCPVVGGILGDRGAVVEGSPLYADSIPYPTLTLHVHVCVL